LSGVPRRCWIAAKITLPAGAVIFAAIQQRLGTPLKVQRGGLREGALLTLAAEQSIAA